MIRGYTNIEQSRKLAEILPLESADMRIGNYVGKSGKVGGTNVHYYPKCESFGASEIIRCWSLAALLDVLPSYFYDETGRKTLGMSKGDTYYYIFYENKNSYIEKRADNPVDACVAMIELLHELKML